MLQGEMKQNKKKGGRRGALRLLDFKEPTQVLQMREHRKKHISDKEGWGQASLPFFLFTTTVSCCASIRPSIELWRYYSGHLSLGTSPLMLLKCCRVCCLVPGDVQIV